MKILVTGDRFHDDPEIVHTVLSGFWARSLFENFTVVEGQCPKGGADLYAAQWAAAVEGVVHDPHPADWNKYGRAAGPIRNQEMLDTDPDVVIAFHDDLENSKGTKDMVERAVKKGTPVYHIRRVGDRKLF